MDLSCRSHHALYFSLYFGFSCDSGSSDAHASLTDDSCLCGLPGEEPSDFTSKSQTLQNCPLISCRGAGCDFLTSITFFLLGQVLKIIDNVFFTFTFKLILKAFNF
ncbi:hypothetical protein ILYODFUR_038161 [Ilyodon furcidens]|uniref:Uncharacterized protein n=1 Tax=Ilyodon furcidens TaxID=33524 RepID=A0ABV0VB58_9TELE